MKFIAIVSSFLLFLVISIISIAVSEKDYSISLMDDWKVKKDKDTKKFGEKFYRMNFNDQDWENAEINMEEPQYTDRFVFYRKWVEIPATWQGKKAKILFSGVDDDAIVYVNEQKAGQHEGWDEPFDIDVTNLIKYGDKNLIAVLCDNSGGDKCGIYGSVNIALVDELAKLKTQQEKKLKAEIMKNEPNCKIIYETYRNNNWELYIS
ncbi:MAG: sugar-binding domain-containing protein, partial [Candidatus Poribacteria bacterium]